MSEKYIIRPVAWVVKPINEPLFSEQATRVEIVDEASGEFLEITDGNCQKIRLDPAEWPELNEVIDRAVKWCNKQEGEK